METTAHELLAAWESFYVIIGSSAAALTGLQFVVIALVADTPNIGSSDSVDAFGTPTVVHFCLCLFVSALLSAPWHSRGPITALLLITGLVGVIYTLIVLRRARRQSGYRPVAEDWVWHTILPLIAYGALTAAAVAFGPSPVDALFVVVAVAVTLIFIGIHNAWDSVAYLAVRKRSGAVD